MRLAKKAKLAMVFIVGIGVGINRFSLQNRNSNELSKRWFRPKTGKMPAHPPQDEGQEGGPARKGYAWPVQQKAKEPGTQPIRYCYIDEKSYNLLHELVEEAIKKWQPAMTDSNMRIEPDPGTTLNGEMRFCPQQGVSYDALIIYDGEDPRYKDPDHECDFFTTIGYIFGAEKIKPGDLIWDRPHHLRWCGDDQKSHAELVRTMTHEIGHAIGFGHEHQRPDRDRWLDFNFRKLHSARQAQLTVNEDCYGYFQETAELEAMSEDERFDYICSDPGRHIAKEYFPRAVDYIKLENLHGDESWSDYAYSKTLDWNSMMMYGSTEDVRAGGEKDPEQWPLARLQGNADGTKPKRVGVWMGGNQDASKAKISVGDIARVAQLYPKPGLKEDQAKKAKGLPLWEPAGVFAKGS